jgi:hypothetical protein
LGCDLTRITLSYGPKELIKIASVFFLFAQFLMVGSSHAAIVEVGDWKFATDIEGWKIQDSFATEKYDSSKPDWESPCGVMGTWKGDFADAFVYPVYPNAPKDNEDYGKISGMVYLYTLKIPEELRKDLQDHDIAVYGSLDKIPEDQKQQELKDILSDAIRNAMNCEKFDSEKDITFGDRMSHLSEGDNNVKSVGAIAILLDDDTVGIIEAYAEKTPREKDGAIFNGRAWDVIETFTVLPK